MKRYPAPFFLVLFLAFAAGPNAAADNSSCLARHFQRSAGKLGDWAAQHVLERLVQSVKEARARVHNRGTAFEAEARRLQAEGKPVVVDFLGVGAGPHNATFYSTLKQSSPDATGVVFEGTEDFGTFDRMAGTFRLNSPELHQLSSNPVHGAPIQVRDFNVKSDRDISSEPLGNTTVEAFDFAETPVVFGKQAPPIEKQPAGETWPAPYRIRMPDGLVVYGRVALAGIGPGKGRTQTEVGAPDSVAAIVEESRAADRDPKNRKEGPPPLAQTGDDFLKEGTEALREGRDPLARYRGKKMLFAGGSHGAYSTLLHAIEAGPNSNGSGKPAVDVVWLGTGGVRDSREIYRPVQTAVENGRITAMQGRLLKLEKRPDGKVDATFSVPDVRELSISIEEVFLFQMTGRIPALGVGSGEIAGLEPLSGPDHNGRIRIRATLNSPNHTRKETYDGVVTNFGYAPDTSLLQNLPGSGRELAPVRGTLGEGLNQATGDSEVTLAYQVVGPRGQPENVFLLGTAGPAGRGDILPREIQTNPGTVFNLFGRRTATLAATLGPQIHPTQFTKLSFSPESRSKAKPASLGHPKASQEGTSPSTESAVLTTKNGLGRILARHRFSGNANELRLTFTLGENGLDLTARGDSNQGGVQLSAQDAQVLATAIQRHPELVNAIGTIAQNATNFNVSMTVPVLKDGSIQMEGMDLDFETATIPNASRPMSSTSTPALRSPQKAGRTGAFWQVFGK